MPRIKGLGELDWDFENVGDFPLEYAQRPVIIEHHHLVGISLLLVADKTLHPYDEPGKWEKALWNYQTRLWEDVVDEYAKPALFVQIRLLLEKLFDDLQAVEVMYFWDGDRRVAIKIQLARGTPAGFDPPKFPVGHALSVTSYGRFLLSLARKMSKWYKEACQTA